MNGAAKSILDGATVLKLDPNDIDIDLGGRIGFYFEDKAVAFGRLLAEDGQRDLVKVSRSKAGSALPWRLHVGLHRTMGALKEGLPIYAVEVSGTPEQLAELEASENLHRRKLEPMEQAKFIGAFCDALQERLARKHGNLTQQKMAAKARWEAVKNAPKRPDQALQEDVADASAAMADAYGWEDSAKEAFDLSARQIYRALKIYRQIAQPFAAEIVRKIADHQVVGRSQKELLELAAVCPFDRRERVVKILFEDREASISSALERLTGETAGDVPRKGLEKYKSQILNGWGKLSIGEQTRFVADGELIKLLTPGMKRLLRVQLEEELGDE